VNGYGNSGLTGDITDRKHHGNRVARLNPRRNLHIDLHHACYFSGRSTCILHLRCLSADRHAYGKIRVG